MNKTLEYYDTNAQEFYNSTVNVDMSNHYQRFLKYLQTGNKVLDFGCGSGRDSRAFLGMGYQVTSIDGSSQLCEIASQLIGQEVIHIEFKDVEYTNEFHGIWACASVLHVQESELSNILSIMKKALITNGVIYISFKYGNFSGERNGRYFNDMTEEKLAEVLKECADLEIVETWITGDVRENRQNEMWLNAILHKQ